MNLAISNLAWQPAEDEPVRAVLREAGVGAIEVAPTKVWPRPLDAMATEVASYRTFWESQGIQIVAVQSILFGRPDLTLFGDGGQRREMLVYLGGMIRLARQLGADVLVFGSVKNRHRGQLPSADAARIAVPFFRELGEIALRNHVAFCIEPTPAVNGCDYVTTSSEGAQLVLQVGCPGFGLHLDSAAMTLGREVIGDSLDRAKSLLRHFHISELQLAPIGSGTVDHQSFAAALRRVGYGGWLSIEMRNREAGANIEQIRESVAFVAATYTDDARHNQPGTCAGDGAQPQ